MDDAYTRLAHAIVVLAAKDYDAELDWFRQNPPRDEEDKQHETYLKHQTELQSLERFFRCAQDQGQDHDRKRDGAA